MGRPVCPPVPQGEPHLSIRGPPQPVLGHWWTEGVPTQPFEALSLARGDDDPGVEVKRELPRVTPTERRGLDLVGRSAAPPDPRTDRDHPLYGRGRDPGQDRRLLSPSIRPAATLIAARQAAALEQTLDAPCHDGDHAAHVLPRQTRSAVKVQDSRPSFANTPSRTSA